MIPSSRSSGQAEVPAATATTPAAASVVKSDSTSHTITSIDFVGAAEALTEFASKLAADDEYRSKYITELVPSLTTAFKSAVDNTNVGETGNRGEKVIITAVVLFVMVLFGVLPRLLLVVSMILKTSATLMIACGLMMSMNAVMELKEQMSVLLIPGTKHKLVSTGIYSLARHPLYGGMILFTFGWAILQDRAYQVLLALALAMVLVSTTFVVIILRLSFLFLLICLYFNVELCRGDRRRLPGEGTSQGLPRLRQQQEDPHSILLLKSQYSIVCVYPSVVYRICSYESKKKRTKKNS